MGMNNLAYIFHYYVFMKCETGKGRVYATLSNFTEPDRSF